MKMMNYSLALSFAVLISPVSYPMNIVRTSKSKLSNANLINRQLEQLRNRWNQLDRQRMHMFWQNYDRSKSMSRLLKEQQQAGKCYENVALKLKEAKK